MSYRVDLSERETEQWRRRVRVYPNEYIVAYLAELAGYESMYTSKGFFGLTYNREMIWLISIVHTCSKAEPIYPTITTLLP